MAELDILLPYLMASASQTRLRGSGGGRRSLSPSQRDPPRVHIRPKWGGAFPQLRVTWYGAGLWKELASSPGPWAGGWLFHEPGCTKKRDRFGDGVGWSALPHFPPPGCLPSRALSTPRDLLV